MPVTYATGEACSSKRSTQNAVPTVQANAKKKPQARKPGWPMTTHRKDHEELFKHLRNNPEGIGVERKEWQIPKWNNFKSGQFIMTMQNFQNAIFENKQRLEVRSLKDNN